MRTLTAVALLVAAEAQAGIGDLGPNLSCDACGAVAFVAVGGTAVLVTNGLYLKELASHGKNLKSWSVVMMIEYGLSSIFAAVFLADGLISRRDPAYVGGTSGWLALSVGMVGLATWTFTW